MTFFILYCFRVYSPLHSQCFLYKNPWDKFFLTFGFKKKFLSPDELMCFLLLNMRSVRHTKISLLLRLLGSSEQTLEFGRYSFH